MTAPPPAVLAVDALRKVYGDLVAVDGISFSVRPGEIVALLGPNGAGKTTTINMVLGVLAPTSGSIHVDGIDLARRRSRALERRARYAKVSRSAMCSLSLGCSAPASCRARPPISGAAT